jgi:hypothetical protein
MQTIKEQTQEEKERLLEVRHSWKTCKQPKRIGRKRTNIGGSTFFKNLQTTREQTHEEKTNTWGCSSLSNWKEKLSLIIS